MRFIIGVLCLLMLHSTDAAVTVTLQPDGSTANSGDAYLLSANPTTNFGMAGALSVAGTGTTKGALASVLKFDLSAAKAAFDLAFGAGAWTLVSVALQLTVVTPNNPNFNSNSAGDVTVDWLADDSWSEAGITWSGLPVLLSAGTQSMGGFHYGGGLGATQYALTAAGGFLADLQAGGATSLHLGAGDAGMSMVMNSRNFSTPANRPALILIASAPEPGRALLAAAGLSLVLLRRRRASTPRASCV